MWRTAALMVAMSPLPVFPFVTPQSIRMCCGPSGDGTVTRKKSPKPTRYMRTRNSPPSPAPSLPLPLDVVFVLAFSFAVAILDPAVRNREVDREPIVPRPLDEAEPLVGRALAHLARCSGSAADVLADRVADV